MARCAPRTMGILRCYTTPRHSIRCLFSQTTHSNPVTPLADSIRLIATAQYTRHRPSTSTPPALTLSLLRAAALADDTALWPTAATALGSVSRRNRYVASSACLLFLRSRLESCPAHRTCRYDCICRCCQLHLHGLNGLNQHWAPIQNTATLPLCLDLRHGTLCPAGFHSAAG
jgi:hypothetical protein